MKHSERKEKKESLIQSIKETQQKIILATSAPRVPQRVMDGDVETASKWKGHVDRAATRFIKQPHQGRSLGDLEEMDAEEKEFLALLV